MIDFLRGIFSEVPSEGRVDMKIVGENVAVWAGTSPLRGCRDSNSDMHVDGGLLSGVYIYGRKTQRVL